MNRFNYPFTRILDKPFKIKNSQNLEPQEIVDVLSQDKRLHKIKTLNHFYPKSDGKIIYRYGNNIWFVIDQVTTDQIKIVGVQRDTALYTFYAFVAAVILLLSFYAPSRPFAFGFIVFSLMVLGLVFLSRKLGDSHVSSKLKEMAQVLNKTL